MASVADHSVILRRVRKLVDKAGSTSSDAERDSLLAKAGELMERHAISAAELEQARQQERREPIKIAVTIGRSGAPGVWAKRALAQAVADTTRCRYWWEELADADGYGSGDLVATFAGMPEDAGFAELLFTHLLLGLERGYRDALPGRPEWTSARTFRSSYFDGYAERVCKRLRAQHAQRERAREADDRAAGKPAGSTALVLAGVAERVDAWVDANVKLVTHHRSRNRVICAAGLHDGRRAGDRADIDAGRTPRLANRPELGRGDT